jgi:hypothetical protein
MALADFHKGDAVGGSAPARGSIIYTLQNN